MSNITDEVFDILTTTPPAERWRSQWEVGEAKWNLLRDAMSRSDVPMVLPPWPEVGISMFALVGLPVTFSDDPDRLALVAQPNGGMT